MSPWKPHGSRQDRMTDLSFGIKGLVTVRERRCTRLRWPLTSQQSALRAPSSSARRRSETATRRRRRNALVSSPRENVLVPVRASRYFTARGETAPACSSWRVPGRTTAFSPSPVLYIQINLFSNSTSDDTNGKINREWK